MVNGAVYIVLAALVIIITIMVWNKKVDKYSHVHGCQMRYRNISDSTERNLKVQECLGHQIMKYGGQQCAKDEDCQQSQVCVLGGYYAGDDGNVFPNSNIGTCIDENEPGAVQWKHNSDFRDPPTHPDDDPPSWASTMSGEISPSKVENYKSETCLPGMYWNSYGNGGRGGCENIFQGSSSVRYLHRQKPDFNTEVSIPGTTLPAYGVGMRDPMDKLTGVIIDRDPGYKHPY